MNMNWSRRLLVALALIGALGLMTTNGYAAEEEEGAEDASARIKKQMEKIRKLMQDNETALLELSAGTKAEPKKVDVDVPPPDGSTSGGNGAGSDGPEGKSGEGKGGSGEGARKSIDELLRKQQENGEPIPEEITRLVKMIPL